MAVTTEVGIANLALYELGSDSIDALSDDNNRARVCNQFYDQSRDEVLVMTRAGWNCAKRRTILAPDNSTPSFDYDNKFRLPSDCLRVLHPTDENNRPIRVEWERRGQYVLMNDDECFLKYIYQLEDVSEMSPLLIKSISLQLATHIAVRLKRSAELKNSIQKDLATTILMAEGTEASEQFALDVMEPRKTKKNLWVDEK